MPRIISPAAVASWWKPEVAPIVGIVGIALGWMTYKGIEHLGAPEVFLDPYRRSADAWEKYDLKEAQEYHRRTAKQFRHKDDSVANLSLFEWTRPGWWSERKEVATKPEAVTGGGKTYLG